MGSYDGAEICELMKLFLLHKFSTIIPKELAGLYRDDGLAILQISSGHNTDQIKKRIIKLFQKHDLKITTKANIIQTNFLVVTLNIKTEKHWSFRKPNDQQLYININCNHPASIKKALPSMKSNRLSKLSCNLDNLKKLFHHIKTQLNKVATQIIYYLVKLNRKRNQENTKSYSLTCLLITMLSTTSKKSF